MANAVYPSYKEAVQKGEIDVTTTPVKVLCVDTSLYTYNAAHDELSDVAEAARIATSGALQNITVALGIFDADDIVLASVSGNPFEALILYVEVAASPESGNPLMCYLDTGYANLPCTPDGGNITIVWPVKIFEL